MYMGDGLPLDIYYYCPKMIVSPLHYINSRHPNKEYLPFFGYFISMLSVLTKPNIDQKRLYNVRGNLENTQMRKTSVSDMIIDINQTIKYAL